MKFIDGVKNFFSKKPVMIVCVVVAVIAVIVAIYFMFFKSYDNTIVYDDYTVANGHSGRIEKYDGSYTVDGYKGGSKAYYVNGNITASADKKFTVITFNLYDKKNKVLGVAVAGLNEVKKGKTYGFKALSLINESDIDKVDHYEIKSIKQG